MAFATDGVRSCKDILGRCCEDGGRSVSSFGSSYDCGFGWGYGYGNGYYGRMEGE